MKLSVVIPIYNVEDWLPACLDSVLDPACGDYEIIAVNDGSTDGSGAIAADYAARWPERIRVISTPNGGLGHARNTGLEAAQGEYLLFLDSDDMLAPGAIGEILTCLDGSFDVGLFDFRAVNEEGRELAYTRGAARSGDFTLADYPQLLCEAPNAVNKLWRRSLFADGVRFPDRVWFEDLATVPRLYLRAGRFRNLARPWYLYLRRGGSIMNSKSLARNEEIIPAVDAVLTAWREAGLFERDRAELEYMALFHQLLIACVRVARVDPHSPVLMRLAENFEQKFPRFRENPYLRGMSRRHRLLLRLILRRRFGAVKALMALNDRVRGRT